MSAVFSRFNSHLAFEGRREWLPLYASALAVTAIVFVAAVVAAGRPLSEQPERWPLLAFAVLALVVERRGIRLTDSLEVSIAFLPLVFVAVVYGPLAAAAVGAAAMLADFGRPHLRWVIWTSHRVLLGCAGGVAADVAMRVGETRAIEVFTATAAATATYLVLDLALTSATLTVRRTGRLREVLRAAVPIAAASVPIYTGAVGILAYAYTDVSPWTAALFFVPAIAAQHLFVVWREQQEALRELGEANERLEKANLSFATALVATLDARDQYTAGHSAAVAIYARDIAASLGLSENEQKIAHLCGLVHDIGKIGLPPGLLEKAGPLTDDERILMQEHSAIGEGILRNVDDYGEIASIVRHHHERFDGAGYPDGVGDVEIPLISRIIGVADAYDAMTSDRPYRAALGLEEARGRLVGGAGTQFDRDVVAAFGRVLDTRGAAYRRASVRTKQAPRRARVAVDPLVVGQRG